ncbi:PhnB protein [Paenibacillus rhizosphaerae]|uniref:PhnB protein n=1 Tax=Paenibacillus rhizosphaerae TaxID=297318 RepID=A0A839TTD9_9BACL|nr:VOC family protein [Paenibacillus rhizosphaerae]MBB3130344.1 PhnB protein [Paenibacillus rhizosphaerae]
MKSVSPLVIVDNCDEALKFYQEVLDGEVKILNKNEDKATFAHFQLDHSLIQFADSATAGYPVARGGNHRIYLQFDHEEEIKKVYEAFQTDGKVDSELQKTFFGAFLAVLTDKFGVNWNLVYSFAK